MKDIDRYIKATRRAVRLGWDEKEGWPAFLDLAFRRILNPEGREI